VLWSDNAEYIAMAGSDDDGGGHAESAAPTGSDGTRGEQSSVEGEVYAESMLYSSVVRPSCFISGAKWSSPNDSGLMPNEEEGLTECRDSLGLP
jgi:hypothetical protein